MSSGVGTASDKMAATQIWASLADQPIVAHISKDPGSHADNQLWRESHCVRVPACRFPAG